MDWAQTLAGFPEGFELKDLREDATAYLIPEYEMLDERFDILDWCAEFVFEEELASWDMDESLWPVVRDAQIFLDWFDIEFHSLVFDLDEDNPLAHIDDDLDPDEIVIDPRSNGH